MALGLASQIDNSNEQARARDGLGHAHHAAGDLGKARDHWREAMTSTENSASPKPIWFALS